MKNRKIIDINENLKKYNIRIDKTLNIYYI